MTEMLMSAVLVFVLASLFTCQLGWQCRVQVFYSACEGYMHLANFVLL